MEYYENIVNRRNSCRRFANITVEQDKLEAIAAFFDEEDRLVPDIDIDLRYYDGSIYEDLGDSVGYNGFAIRAPEYMVIFSEVADHYMENAGFTSQALTMKLTELGLAACWQTINDADAVKSALGENTDKVVASVIAFGYRSPDDDSKPAPKISYTDIAYSGTYGEPLDNTMLYRELEDALRAAAHAQSFNNKQPYRLIVDHTSVSLIGIPDEGTNESDELLNYGIVMYNFQEVMDAVRNSAPKWIWDAPDRDLRLPAGAKFIAMCRL